MNPLLDAALQYADEGLRVFPLAPRGKTPLIAGGHTNASSDPDQIRAWWEQHPEANIGLVCGDGLAVLDVDGQQGLDALNELVAAAEHASTNTKIVRTGGGGWHFYFLDSRTDPLPQSAGKIGTGLDIRAGGKGYVVAPPSIHPNGTPYELHNGAVAGPVWPWLRELAQAAANTRAAPTDPEEPIREGGRNQALASLAGSLRDKGLGADAIRAALHAENQRRCVPPLDDAEVDRIARSISRYTPTRPYTDDLSAEQEFEADPHAEPPTKTDQPRRIELTDEWVVDRVLPFLGSRIRFVTDGKGGDWYLWEGHRWSKDVSLAHERAVRETLRRFAMRLEERGAMAPNKKEGAPFMTTARRIQGASGINSILSLVRAPLATPITAFDGDRDLLNTPAGVINLETGELHPSETGQMFTLTTGVPPAEGTPRGWLAFLGHLTGGDEEMIRYIQKVAGYCLTGEVSEKLLFYIWGSNSDTGKSTFVRILNAVLGAYADQVDVSVFIGSNDSRIPAELARLPGKRLVTATEPAADTAWDEKRIKAITGGDTIEARFLYGNPFTFDPQFKIVIVGNHEPEIRNVDDAMLRRIHIIPMNRKVAREKQIPDLSRRLVEKEGPQILQWMIDGCLLWRAEGLTAPETVRAKTQQYEEDEDLLGQWLQEECEFDPEYEASRSELYQAWSSWCRSRGENPGRQRTLKKAMDARADELHIRDALVGDRRLAGYHGVRLRPRVGMGTEFSTA